MTCRSLHSGCRFDFDVFMGTLREKICELMMGISGLGWAERDGHWVSTMVELGA